jgi:hypothetical protein
VRGAARGLIFAAIASLLVLPTVDATAAGSATFLQAFRALDGEQFLEDEPIWFCVEDDDLGRTGSPYLFRLVGVEDSGGTFLADASAPMDFTWVVMRDAKGKPIPPTRGPQVYRAGEFVSKFGPPVRPELSPLFLWHGGLRAGRYEIQRTDVKPPRAIATFRVIRPRGSELSVRAGLARVNRLLRSGDPENVRQAAALSAAILGRYPRTSYRTIAFLATWSQQSTFGENGDAGAWLEEAFGHFHDSCFGVWALEQAMRRSPSKEFFTRLRRLVGLYPDTRLSRAAAQYLQ